MSLTTQLAQLERSHALATARGQISRVRQLTQELENLSGAHASIMLVYGTRGWQAEIQHVLGDNGAALAHSRDLETWAKKAWPLGRAWTLGNLIFDLARNEQFDQAKRMLARAHQEKLGDFYSFGPMSVARGETELALALGDGAWALRTINGLVEKLEGLRIEFYLPEAYVLRGRALVQLNLPDEAAAAFTRMQEIGERIPARIHLWKAYADWGEMEDKRGNTQRAHVLRTQAAEHVMYITDQWDTPALRKQFLNQPRVRALFDSIAAAAA